MSDPAKIERITRSLAYMLRHQPEKFDLEIDPYGFATLAEGKARYEIFDRDMHQNAVKLLKLETELRRGVHRGDFVMNYQPIVSLGGTSRIVGFEGLVRWKHPERGIVTPGNFIAIAEETGLMSNCRIRGVSSMAYRTASSMSTWTGSRGRLTFC